MGGGGGVVVAKWSGSLRGCAVVCRCRVGVWGVKGWSRACSGDAVWCFNTRFKQYSDTTSVPGEMATSKKRHRMPVVDTAESERTYWTGGKVKSARWACPGQERLAIRIEASHGISPEECNGPLIFLSPAEGKKICQTHRPGQPSSAKGRLSIARKS